MSQFIDQEINGYKVQKAIGEGKFSTVYKAMNNEGNVVALKKIKVRSEFMLDIWYDGSKIKGEVFKGGEAYATVGSSKHYKILRLIHI